MENKPIESVYSTPQTSRHPKHRFSRSVRITIIVVVIVAVLGFIFIPIILNTNKNNSNAAKVLTIEDLDKSDVELGSNTSDASVKNITDGLKSKIEKQITDKENPIDTVLTLAAVLRSTANATRATQGIDYVTTFLATKMDTLKLSSAEYGQPDELRITYWKAQLYANLVHSYKFIMDNELKGADGKPLVTTSEQLKYVNLYLEIAQNSTNWGEPQTNGADGRTWYYYAYDDTDSFLALREQLVSKGVQ